ncbi:FAD-linked oxidase C-terminal domain-containing protein [Desulfoluna sp.]|uniref:FAD-binding oxidoreductase n=1 Tax=Desulfoluna sp. TaxID=2045199 RepID=UPI00261AE770|nr:FAD-linked oxidase C-terminal domain-containing protein [Desulfoluna sp.]
MISGNLKKEFENLLGEKNVMGDEVTRMNYAYDAAVLDPVMPALVLRPDSSEQLGAAIRLCGEHGVPATVRGAGTNLSGGTIPYKNGVVILTNAMNKIIEINEVDMYAIVQPGVVTADFAAAVAAKGLFYPPDPGSMKVSTLAGNVAENAGGLRGLKYGVTKDYVMGMDFFDVEGNLIKTGSKTVKGVTGFNVSGLMIASEGCLGVFNEITLKLIPPPRASKCMMAIYDSVAEATESVAAIIAAKIVPCTLEFMDNFTIRAVEDYAKVGLPLDAKALLLIEVDGHPAEVADDAAKVEEICKKYNARDIHVAKDEAEKNKVWEARRAALSALAKLKPTLVLEDATVPRSKIPDMVSGLDVVAAKYGLSIGTFGHAGDGNLHPTILCDRRDEKEWHKVETAVKDIFDLALGMGGTLSGEHGIGIAKAGFMAQEVGEQSLSYFRKIKKAVDPKGILNPGKVIGD